MVHEKDLVCRVKVPRFKCRVCKLVVSLLLGFLLPYKHYSIKIVCDATGNYHNKPTTYGKTAAESSALDQHELPRPAASRVFEWVDDFSKHAKETIGLRINRACVREGKEKSLGKEVECPNSEKAYTLEKAQRLNLSATVVQEALALVKSSHLLRRLRAYLLENVEDSFDIFCGHHSRLSLSQNSELVF
ncbi:MAG: hypothetical protein MN733_06795 [Nitrososphaera sp.]|nr:hypothetical protein [Nitrososphaera sp.]